MSEMRVAGDGLAHARFVAEFFSGPVDGYSASSSDNGVATAGVQPPDLLIVAPVSNGSASVTVTASGPGGTATQTLRIVVGQGSDQSWIADAVASAPPPPPPAAQEPFVPTEELPPEAPISEAPPPDDPTSEGVPTDSLTSAPVTEAPTLSGSIPEQTVIVGQSRTVDVNPYFTGVVQGWSAQSSAPTNVPVSMSIAGVLTLDGQALGTSTVTVTATNDIGSVAQTFRVSVKTVSAVVLTLVGDNPRVSVGVGESTTLDLSQYFSEAATGFDVTYDRADPNRRADVTVSGSVATIQGRQTGTTTITLVARTANTTITRPATVQVTN